MSNKSPGVLINFGKAPVAQSLHHNAHATPGSQDSPLGAALKPGKRLKSAQLWHIYQATVKLKNSNIWFLDGSTVKKCIRSENT